MDLTLKQAYMVISACEQRAREMGKSFAIAVVGAEGHLKAAVRMDGAAFLTPEIAQAKAYTAAFYRRDTENVVAGFQNRPIFAASMSALTNGRVLYGRGGFVLQDGGAVVGAVGVSGSTEDDDSDVGRAGVAAFAGARSEA
jgi:uncharacterized protein GlcG (DUF336 family)